MESIRKEFASCEFCSEFSNHSNCTFNQIYSGLVENRILSESYSFLVIPTIGQLFKFSLLIIPKKHVETLSDLSETKLVELEKVYSQISFALSSYGSVVAFEHGGRAIYGGGCGIYHAHLHLVPLPQKTSTSSFLEDPEQHNSLIEAFKNVKSSKEYLLAIDNDSSIVTLDLSYGIKKSKYPSQYFRRKLSEYFKLSKPWDWRKYITPEKELLESIHSSTIPRKMRL